MGSFLFTLDHTQEHFIDLPFTNNSSRPSIFYEPHGEKNA